MKSVPQPALAPPAELVVHQPPRVLILGHGEKVKLIRRHLNRYLPPGNQVILAGSPEGSDETTAKAHLRHYNDLHRRIGPEFNVVVLADTDDNHEVHDAKTILKMVPAHAQSRDCRIVAEFLDPANAQLADIAHGEKVANIITTDVISNYMIQCVREPERCDIFKELISANGTEIGLVDPDRFLPRMAGGATFNEYQRAARFRDELLIGYATGDGLKLNPRECDLRLKLCAGSRLVVLLDLTVGQHGIDPKAGARTSTELFAVSSA